MIGCVQTDTIEVEVIPFVVEDIDYEKEDADCWEDGSIQINSIQVNYERGEHSYTRINQITGKRSQNMETVPEGIYQIEVTDERECTSVYEEDITIEQKCLEDYPVFTPNQDGTEDEYFIPYVGTVRIFDRNGTLMKELTTPAYWDGTDNSGTQMPMGNYLMLTEKGRVVNITIIR